MSGKNRLLYKMKQNKSLLLMLAPAVVFFLVFAYIPMAGIVLAFQNFNLRDRFFSPFVGLQNFRFLFITGDVWGVARNTILYNIVFISVNTSLAVGFAIMLSEIASKYFRKLTQSMMFMPYFISWVTAGAFAYSMLNYDNGLINAILKSIQAEPADFYNNANIWPVIIVLFNSWKLVGFSTVIYLSAITGIDTQMYEAADIDGANIFHRIWHITIPSLIPTIIVMILLSVGNIFRGDFNMFYQLVGNNAALLPTTDVVDTFVTRALISSNNIGMAASAGLFQSVVCFITIISVNRAVKAYDREYALF